MKCEEILSGADLGQNAFFGKKISKKIFFRKLAADKIWS